MNTYLANATEEAKAVGCCDDSVLSQGTIEQPHNSIGKLRHLPAHEGGEDQSIARLMIRHIMRTCEAGDLVTVARPAASLDYRWGEGVRKKVG